MGTSINFDKILGYSKGCNIMLANLGTQLLLDLYPNAAVAYSLRKLRTAYAGSAIRVRRSVDNAEQDIAFVGNDLDTTSMLDFVGYNLFLYSEDFSNAYWGKSRLNTTGTPAYVDVEIAPDGTLTGDKMIEDTTGSPSLGLHGQTKTNIAYLASTDYNVSVYLKQGERTKVRIDSEIEGTYKQCDLDLTNGSISNNTFTNTPIVTAEANGWYRFSVTITSLSAGSRAPLRVFMYNGANLNYLGDGTSGCYIWGFQLSQTSSVKTYQKTVATAAGAGFVTTWYDQSTNANNSTQATAANQAQVVLNGNLILDVDTNKITTTWTTDRYNLTIGISPNTKYLSVSAVRRQTTSGILIAIGVSGAIGGPNGQTPLIWLGTGDLRSHMPSTVIHNTITTADGYIITSEKNASNLKTMYLNGVAQPTTATEAPSTGNNINVFGQAGANYTLGQYQEYIYWDSEQSANRVGIETDINTYWNAY